MRGQEKPEPRELYVKGKPRTRVDGLKALGVHLRRARFKTVCHHEIQLGQIERFAEKSRTSSAL